MEEAKLVDNLFVMLLWLFCILLIWRLFNNIYSLYSCRFELLQNENISIHFNIIVVLNSIGNFYNRLYHN